MFGEFDHSFDAGGAQGGFVERASSRRTTRRRVSAQASTRSMFASPPRAAMPRGGFARGIGIAQFRDAAAAARGRGKASSTSSASGPAVLRYSSISVFRVLASGAEDRLHAVADHHHAGGAERLEFVRAGLGHVVELHAQSRDAGVEAGDVAASAEGAHESAARTVAARGAAHRFRASSSTSRPGVMRLNLRIAKLKTP